ncbi:hypothetical protein SH661x_004562 [Planctomicrobium sp. SH661]|uniref:hypothetical protein n=1 Tax=Planctomicrobium sp. SH661 TaxID=3448124 RepID=UPI003F5C622D
MISEIRIHPGHESPVESSSSGRRELPLMCPHCQQSINLVTGLCGNRLIDAILLQSERIGTELECGRCGLRFVFHRTGSGFVPRQTTPNRESIAGHPARAGETVSSRLGSLPQQMGDFGPRT